MKEIKQAYEAIDIPAGLESRLEEKLEASLGAPLREKHVIIKPRARVWKPLLTAAAVLILLVSAALLRQLYASGSHPAEIIPAAETVQIIPAAEPAGTEGSPEKEEEYLSLYQPVLDAYCYAFESYDYDYCKEHGLYDLFIFEYYYAPHVLIGYALRDLDGDGTPELLIGPPKDIYHPEATVLEMLYDAYYLRDGVPVQFFRADSTNSWRVLEDGRCLQTMNERLSSPSYLLWQFMTPLDKETAALTFLDGVLLDNYSDPQNKGYYRVKQVSNKQDGEENGPLTFTLGEPVSGQEAQGWIREHSNFLTPAFMPIVSKPDPSATPLPETPPEGMTEQQYLELRLFLQEMAQQEEAFALTGYKTDTAEGVVTLLEEIGLLARDRGLVPSQMRGLLLGRLDLDGASAEAYAALMGELYRLNPKDFLQAWHEAGEPSELMQEVTGVLDPALSKLWLRRQWEASTLAPAPDPTSFGSVSVGEADSIRVVLARARELELLGENETVAFDLEANFDESAEIEYYLDDTILVICWKEKIDGNTCSFAEVKLADPDQLRRYDGAAGSEEPTWSTCTELHQSTNAVLSLNGDYFCGHDLGVVVLDGSLTRFSTEPYTGSYEQYNCLETCLVDEQGDFHFTELGQEFSEEELQQYLKQNKIRFSLTFGPVLVRDGEVQQCGWYPLGEIDRGYSRAGIGQVDRLHYLYMSVNHSPEAEARWTVNQFARHFGEKPVRNAYCLDGGQTAELVFRERPYNTIDYGTERPVSDNVYFVSARSGETEG